MLKKSSKSYINGIKKKICCAKFNVLQKIAKY